jgi:hypothetical protein
VILTGWKLFRRLMHKFRQKLEGVQASGMEFSLFIWVFSSPSFFSRLHLRLSFPRKSKKRHHSLFFCFLPPIERPCFGCFSAVVFSV